MQFLARAPLCLLLAWATHPPAAAVMNGKDGAPANEFDYVVGINIRPKNSNIVYPCSGSIVKDHWILSAGHCIAGTNPATHEIEAKVGAKSMAVGDSIMGEKWFTHPSYRRKVEYEKYYNDIALIKTKESVIKKRNIAFASLPSKMIENPKENSMVEVVGFGGDGDTSSDKSGILQKGKMVVKGKCVHTLPLKHCIHVYVKEGRSCPGDSGGSMVYNGIVVGVSSRGAPCTSIPGDEEYVRVFDYVAWIKRITTKPL